MDYVMPMTLGNVHYIPIYFLLLSRESRWSYLCDWITLICSLLYNLPFILTLYFFISNEMVEDHRIFIITLNLLHLVEFYTSEIIL